MGRVRLSGIFQYLDCFVDLSLLGKQQGELNGPVQWNVRKTQPVLHQVGGGEAITSFEIVRS